MATRTFSSYLRCIRALAVTVLMLAGAQVRGQIPNLLNYQGVLSDASRTAVPDGNYTLTFRIYDSENGGVPLWEETGVVSTLDGVFETTLGLIAPITLPFDTPYWLALELQGEAEMTPRLRLVSTPYALNARSAVLSETATTLDPDAPDVVHRLNGLDGRVTLVGTGLATISEAGSTITVAVPNLLPTDATDGQVIRWNDGLGGWEAVTLVTSTTDRLTGDGSPGAPLDIARMGALDQQPLVWNDGAGRWEPGEAGVSVVAPLRGTGLAGDPLGLEDGAAAGQVILWNGSAWVRSASVAAAQDEVLRWDAVAGTWTPGEESVEAAEEITGDGTVGAPLRLASQGAAAGQVLRWDDVEGAWRPGSVVELRSPPLVGSGDPGDPLRLVDGSNAGQILYWNGTAWMRSAPVDVEDGWVMRWNAGVRIWEPHVVEVSNIVPLTAGAMWYGDAGGTAAELPIGTPDQVLTVDPSGTRPVWSGDLNVNSVNAVTLTTSGNASVGGNLSTAGNATIGGDGTITGDLTVNGTAANLPAGSVDNTELENSTIDVTYSAGLSGDPSVSLGGTLNVQNTGVTSATAGAGIGVDQSTGDLTIMNTGVISLTGTANQVIVDRSTGDVTLSLPQDIHTDATPTFDGATLDNLPTGSTSEDLVVSNGGSLETRTFGSLHPGGILPAGTVIGTTLRWDGMNWVENTNVTSDGAGNVTIAGDVNAGGDGTIAGDLTVSGTAVNLPAGSVDNTELENSTIDVVYGTGLSGDASVALGGTLNVQNTGVISLSGTANQVIVDQSTGDVTLSLPQDIHTDAVPTFDGATLDNLPTGSTSEDLIVSNGGSLETRTFGSLHPGGVLPAGTVIGTMLRWDGTNWVENTNVTSDAAGNVTIAGDINSGGDVTIAGDLTVNGTAANLPAGSVDNTELENSTIDVVYGTGLSGDPSVALGGTLNVQNTGVTSATAGAGIGVDQSTGDLTITNTGVISLTGTANQVMVDQSTGDVMLSLPQDIHTDAVPTFDGLVLDNLNGGESATELLVIGNDTVGRRTIASLAPEFEDVFWTTTGNAGTTAGTNFIGTTDGTELHIYVDSGNANALILGTNGSLRRTVDGNARGTGANDLQRDRTASSQVAGGDYSAILGGRQNAIASTAPNASIVAGVNNRIAADAQEAFIGGGSNNTIEVQRATIIGGRYNHIGAGSFTAVVGGFMDTIFTGSWQSIIAGGGHNTINNGSVWATISGGGNNAIGDNATGATVSGGDGNTIEDAAGYAAVGGGQQNSVFSSHSVVSGGQNNSVSISGQSHSTIGGGQNNTISDDHVFIGGGQGNSVGSSHSTIVGGRNNTIQNGVTFAFIGGGDGNTLSGGNHTVIGGGLDNTLSGNQSVIVGGSGNSVGSDQAAVVTGLNNTIEQGGNYAGAIISGRRNYIRTNSARSFIGAGENDSIHGSQNSAIVAGLNNSIGQNASNSFIGAGQNNTITSNAAGSVIAGGENNSIAVPDAVISGGSGHTIASGAGHAVISGGTNNAIGAGSWQTTIGGGSNTIGAGSWVATIAGGSGGQIGDNSAGSTIGGGSGNVINGRNSVIPGGRELTLNGASSFGFLGNQSGNFDMTVTADEVALFGNTDLWLANNNNGSSQIRFYEANNTTGNFPNGTNYSSFEARNQGADIEYLLPDSAGVAGDLLGVASVSGTQVTLDWRSAAINVSDSAWSLAGNAGTTPGTDFIGTTDAQGLHVYVNGGNDNSLILNTNGSLQRDNGGDARGISAVDLQLFRSNSTQVAAGDRSVIGGGGNNTVATTAPFAVIAGGERNGISDDFSVIGGGDLNSIASDYSVIGGGNQNVIETDRRRAVIGGGFQNSITTNGESGTISGGRNNTVSGDRGTVGGGQGNTVSSIYATIAGGRDNRVGSGYSMIAGGQNNTVNGHHAFIGGGQNDTITNNGEFSVIGGGEGNAINDDLAVIGGGQNNYTSSQLSVINGGRDNTIGNGRQYGYIGGGVGNSLTTSGRYGTIVAGTGNTVQAEAAFVGSGEGNTVSGDYGVASGGRNNTTGGDYSAIPGGRDLTLNSQRSFGFLASDNGATPMTVSDDEIALFGNVDLWLANNDGTPGTIRFYESETGTGTFPSTTNFTSFGARDQGADIEYLLPDSAGIAGDILTVASVSGTQVTLDWDAVSAGSPVNVSDSAWSRTGNAGTSPGTDFLGTVDNQAFQIHVDNGNTTGTDGRGRVMRFEPNGTSANIIGGFQGNSAAVGVVGATIAGGGLNGAANSVGANYATVGGGRGNSIASGLVNGTIGGGSGNIIDATADNTVIGGGLSNFIGNNTDDAVIGGGTGNYIAAGSGANVIGGGLWDTIGTASYQSAIGGGALNKIGSSSHQSTIAGGRANLIDDSSPGSTVAGGVGNRVTGRLTTIAGGRELTLDGNGSFGFLSNHTGNFDMTVTANGVAVFGNTDLWLANNNNGASQLRFYEANSSTGAFPSGTNYTAFVAGTQTADIIYTLPTAAPAANGQVLTSTTGGTMSWDDHLGLSNNSAAVPTMQLENTNGSGTALEVVDGNTVLAYGNGTNATIPDDVTVWVVDDNAVGASGVTAALPAGGTNGQFLYVLYNDADNGSVGGNAVSTGDRLTFIHANGGWVLWHVN